MTLFSHAFEALMQEYAPEQLRTLKEQLDETARPAGRKQPVIVVDRRPILVDRRQIVIQSPASTWDKSAAVDGEWE